MKRIKINDPILMWGVTLVYGYLLFVIILTRYLIYVNTVPPHLFGIIIKYLFFFDCYIGAPGILLLALARGGTIHQAARKGRVEILSQIFNANQNINRRTLFGYTPLHIAVIHKQRSAVDALLKMGADSTLPNLWGSTPTESAKRLGAMDIANSLKEMTGRQKGSGCAGKAGEVQ